MCTGESSDNTVSFGCIPFYKPYISFYLILRETLQSTLTVTQKSVG